MRQEILTPHWLYLAFLAVKFIRFDALSRPRTCHPLLESCTG
jgi:hypothetical protein